MVEAGIESGALSIGAGLALLHSLWQGALVALLLWGALGLIDRRRASLRYNVSCLALGVLALLPLATGLWLGTASARNPEAAREAAVAPALTLPGESLQHGGAVARPATATAPPVAPESAAERARRRAQAQDREGPVSEYWRSLVNWSYRAAPWLCLFWGAGVLTMSSRLALSAWGVRILKRRGTEAVDREWREEFNRLARELGIRRTARLLRSGLVQVPMLVGWLRPVVLIPATALTGLPPEYLRLLLVHELAHLRRLDPLVQLLQCATETLLFYHPAVWWVSRRIRLEREHCCDDLTVAFCRNPLAYAEALGAMAGLASRPVALAVAANGGRLLSRIQRLLEPSPASDPRAAGVVAGILAVVVAVGFAWTAHGATRQGTMHFPETGSIGTLYIRDAGGDFNPSTTATGAGEGWRYYVEAQGWVDIPKGTDLMLRVAPTAVADLSALADLGANDLQKLDLSNCGLTDDALAWIEGLTGLKSLNLYANGISDEGLQYLEGMASLVWLDVERTNVTGARAPVLNTLHRLEYFDAYATPFSDAGVERLLELPNLKVIGLEGTPVSAGGFARLSEIPTLEELNLEETDADDRVLNELADLPLLRALNVGRCPITDDGLAALAKGASLETLNIRNTPVSDRGVAKLEGLPRLRHVMTEGTAISSEWLTAFETAAQARTRVAEIPMQSSTNPAAPRVGVLFSHFTATGPSCRNRAWGYLGQGCVDLASLLDEYNFDVYALVEPGTAGIGELPGVLEATRLTAKTLDVSDAAALRLLDVIVCKSSHNLDNGVLEALAAAVRNGVGLVNIGPVGDETPEATSPLVPPLTNIEQGKYMVGPLGECPVLAPHPILGSLKAGETVSVSMTDGFCAPKGLQGGTAILGAPAGSPSDFYAMYVHSLGKGRVVHMQWYNLIVTGTPFRGKYDIYARAVNWAGGRDVESRW